MDLKKHILEQLKNGKTLQLATVANGKPWISTVYFVADHNLDFYWLSFPSRRHSKDIENEPSVAVAVQIKTDRPVIGVQAEGNATTVNDLSEIEKVLKLYVGKYEEGKQFVDNFKAGKNEHALYKLESSNVVIFDEFNFPGEGPKSWQKQQ